MIFSGPVADFMVQPFNHIVSVDSCPMFVEEIIVNQRFLERRGCGQEVSIRGQGDDWMYTKGQEEIALKEDKER